MGVKRPDIEQHVVRVPEDVARRYRDGGVWEPLTIGARFHRVALEQGDKDAFVTLDDRLSWADADRRTDQLAAALLRLGLVPGDRVLFQIGNTVEAAVAYFGVLKAGLIPVCSIAAHREREMSYLAEHAEARAYLVQGDWPSQDLQELAATVRAGAPQVEHVIVARGDVRDGNHDFAALAAAEDPAEARATVGALELDPEAVAVFQLSGGTTGVPKIIARFHMEYAYNALAYGRAWGFDPDVRLLHVLPLIHNAGIVFGQAALLHGGTLIIAPDPSAPTILELIQRERATDFHAALQAVLLRIFDFDEREQYDLSSLQRLVMAIITPDTVERVERELGFQPLQMFGMGEGTCMYTPPDADRWVGRHTVGHPVSELDEVEIRDPDSGEQLPHGQSGELCARGPYTIRGYYRSPERNAVAFTPDGFYRTGDLAKANVVDGVPYYSIEGRIKDVIMRGAEKVNAEEVEELLVEHPQIKAAALVAMPDRQLGEKACAYVIAPGDAPGLQELCTFLLERGLAKYKLPERVEVVAEFPLTEISKISKADLRADVARKLEAEAAQPTG